MKLFLAWAFPGYSSKTICFGVGSLPIAVHPTTQFRVRLREKNSSSLFQRCINRSVHVTKGSDLPQKYHYNVDGTSVKNLRREYSDISLTNTLKINARRAY